MTTHKVDYQKIASAYDAGRPSSEQNLAQWSNLVRDHASLTPDSKVLDLGCGTGRFALAFHKNIGCQVTGADASSKMLDIARAKAGADSITWEIQQAEQTTYPDETFDAVFMSHVLHHFDLDKRDEAIAECARILKPLGTLLIRYATLEQIRDDPEHRHFPAAVRVDAERTQTEEEVKLWMAAAGLEAISSEEILQTPHESADARLDTARNRSISVLHLISDDEYVDGLAALESYATENPEDPWFLRDLMTLSVGHKLA